MAGRRGCVRSLGAYLIAANAVTIATQIWMGVQWLLNAALTANPIGKIIVTIGALVGAIIYAWRNCGQFQAILQGVWKFMKAMFNWIFVVPIKILFLLGKMIYDALRFDFDAVAEDFNEAKKDKYDGAVGLATSFKKGYEEGMKDFEAAQAAEGTNAPQTQNNGKPPTTKPPKRSKTDTTKAIGSKKIVIISRMITC